LTRAGSGASADAVERRLGSLEARMVVVVGTVDEFGDLLEALAASDVELRVTPGLTELWAKVISSSLEFSGDRLRNARQPGP
jgi:hypothetical protein